MKKYIGTKEVLRQLILSQGDLRDIEEDIENTSVGSATKLLTDKTNQ